MAVKMEIGAVSGSSLSTPESALLIDTLLAILTGYFYLF